jgi:hypothetical protein
MHIDDVSRSMEKWLRRAVPDVDVAFVPWFGPTNEEAGADGGDKPRVEVCFQSIAHEKPDRGSLNRNDVFLLTYLLRVTGADALETQRAFSEIYFAARENVDFDVGEPLSLAEEGFTGPRGGRQAVLSLTARLVRPPKAAAPGIVTEPLTLHLRSLGRIVGKVVTADGRPIMSAEIEARALNKRAVSDSAGRFVIVGAPATGALSLTVRARNKSLDVSVDAEKQADVVIVVPKEGEHE